MRNFFCLLLLGFGLLSSVRAQTASTKQEDIRQLMELTGTSALMSQSMHQFIQTMKQANNMVPVQFWTNFEKEVNFQELVEQLIPIYDAHYTHEEIKGLLAFYKAPLGQKLLKELPAIMQESSAVGRAWGEKLGKRVAEQIQQEREKAKN